MLTNAALVQIPFPPCCAESGAVIRRATLGDGGPGRDEPVRARRVGPERCDDRLRRRHLRFRFGPAGRTDRLRTRAPERRRDNEVGEVGVERGHRLLSDDSVGGLDVLGLLVRGYGPPRLVPVNTVDLKLGEVESEFYQGLLHLPDSRPRLGCMHPGVPARQASRTGSPANRTDASIRPPIGRAAAGSLTPEPASPPTSGMWCEDCALKNEPCEDPRISAPVLGLAHRPRPLPRINS